jgi:hypothetical protein
MTGAGQISNTAPTRSWGLLGAKDQEIRLRNTPKKPAYRSRENFDALTPHCAPCIVKLIFAASQFSSIVKGTNARE